MIQPVLATSDVQILLTDNESEFGAEFLEALRFSYDNGLTRFKTIETFRPYDELTREQAAKIVGVFAEKVMEYEKDPTKTCLFNDIETADPTLQDHILNSCKMGIFKGTSAWDFLPSRGLSKAEALTVIIRMFNGEPLDESSEPRYLNYYLEARDLELTKEKNIFALERPLTRYEMILLLYRFYVKYSLLELLSSETWVITDGDGFGIKTVGNGVVLVDSKQFLDDNVQEITVEIDDTMYRLKKSNLILQFENAYTRYGDAHTIGQTDDTLWEYVWVSTFNIVNGVVTDGNIRPIELHDRYYDIMISDISPFYKVVYAWEWAPDPSVHTNSETQVIQDPQEAVSETELPENTIPDSEEPWETSSNPPSSSTTCSALSIQGQCEELSSCRRTTVNCGPADEPIMWCTSTQATTPVCG